jgi:hypothetical protein
MKAVIHGRSMSIEVDGGTQVDLFKALADAEEVFLERCCGLCKAKDLRFVVRTIEGNDYHELQCAGCGAKLAFGKSRQRPGAMFPIRKLVATGPEAGRPSRKDGEYGEHRGWSKWCGKPVDDDEPPAPATQGTHGTNAPRAARQSSAQEPAASPGEIPAGGDVDQKPAGAASGGLALRSQVAGLRKDKGVDEETLDLFLRKYDLPLIKLSNEQLQDLVRRLKEYKPVGRPETPSAMAERR